MTISIPTDVRDTMLQAVIDEADANGASTGFQIWQGIPIPTASDPPYPTDIMLALILTDDFPSFPAPVTGSSTQTLFLASTTLNPGQPHYFRFVDAMGNTIFQGKVGQTGDGTADLTFPNIAWQSDAEVDISSFTISVPESCA